MLASGAAMRLPAAAALILVPALAPVPTAPKDQSVVVTEEAQTFVVTVPVSRLVMTIPKGDLKEVHERSGGATDHARYFYLQGKDPVLIVTGWFEPDRLNEGIQDLWNGEVAAWKKRGDPEPKDVSFEKLGGWEAVVYDVASGPLENSHIRASWVQAGTWIDVHFSLTADRPTAERRQRLREALGAIQVAEKK
jgi:hypothetical protein